MQFTYTAYINLLTRLRSQGYEVANYHNWQGKKKCVILRHDIDNSITKALSLAEKEAGVGVSSTYFVIVTSDFYNVNSRHNREKLKKMASLGHEIGVHFDELAYPDAVGDGAKITEMVAREGRLLSDVIGQKVSTVSMHRPSKGILEANLAIPGFVNSYSDTFFRRFKYVSDSRRRWREPVEQYVESGEYDRLHILTHAFWYHDEEIDMHRVIETYVNAANQERYGILNENFTDLGRVMERGEVR